jgi:ABC-type antimicrobial peptide transport system ATPase subunit
VRHADLILVMEDGRIVERGAHAELLAAGGVYAGLVGSQEIGIERGHALSIGNFAEGRVEEESSKDGS